MTHYSVIVLGGGTMGTAAAWELAKRGEKALVLEQFSHVHTLGSHSGQTRVIRHAYSEDPDYVPFVLRADELWSQLMQASGEHFFHRVGVLELAPSANDAHAQRARESADAYNLDFEWIDADEIRRRWPQFAVADDWRAGFGSQAGFLEVEPSLRAMARLARASGVEFREQAAVTAWGATQSGVLVETANGRETADRLVIAPGAWAGSVLARLDLPLQVARKTLWWLDVRDPDRFAPDRLPVFMGSRGESEFYGFPIYGEPGLKIADHQGGEPTTPDAVERETRPGEEGPVVDGARWLFGPDAITGEAVKSAVCLYTRTPDGHFIIDRHPEHANVVLAAGFSGHGFKFATAVGEHLVDLLFDPSARPYSILSLDRFR